MAYTTELELTDGQEFEDFSGGLFARIPVGAIFAAHQVEGGAKRRYVYDPLFREDAKEWVVRGTQTWTVIMVEDVLHADAPIGRAHG